MLLTQILQKIKSAFYTKSEIDTKLSGKSDTSHNHNSTYLGIKAKAESAKSADSVAWANVSGKPTIPTVNNATLTIQKNGTTVKTFTANSSTNVTANITVPTKVSDLTNDLTFIRKPDGLKGQILTQNNNEITSENPIQLLNLVNTQEELNNALSSVPLTLQDVFNNWYRFAHSTDTVQNNTTADGVQDALNGWYYDSSLNAIGNTVNSTSYVGFVSDKTYKNWYMKTKGIGPNDDDQMSIIAAFMTDSNGYEHTLSVIRSGGLNNGQLTGTDGVDYSFALVLDYNHHRWNRAKVLAGITTSQLKGSQWPKGSHISVRRNGNTITAKTSQFGSDNLNIEFTYTVPTSQGSLSDADYTNIRLMLNNKSKIGFGMESQPGYFILEETEGIFDDTDIYDALNNKVYTYNNNNGWVQNGTVSSKVLNLSRIYNEKTDKLFYYKDEKVYQLNTSSDLSPYATKSDLANKANDSDVVHKSDDETISGTKIFTDKMFLKSSTFERGNLPSTDVKEDREFEILDKNNKRIFSVFNYYFTNGNGKSVMYAYNPNTTDYDLIGISFDFDNINSQKSFVPNVNDDYNLGTPALKWKDVYTVLLNGKTPSYEGHTHSYLPLKGGQMTGTNINKNSDDSYLSIRGATSYTQGAYISLYGKDSDETGKFYLCANNGTANKQLVGSSDGTLTWSNTNISLEGHTHTEYLGKSDKAVRATTADKITLTNTNPTSVTSYQITFATSTSNNTQRVNNGLKYCTLEGTESANGYGQLFLGNSTAGGTAGNKYGSVRLYSKSSNYTVISGNTSLTGNRTLTVPDATGTLICTGNLTTTLGSGSSAGGLSDASIGIGSLVLGYVFVADMAAAISSTKSNGFLNISGSSIRLASVSSKSTPNNIGLITQVSYVSDSPTLSGTWRFLGYDAQEVSGTDTSNLGTLGLFIRIA